MLCRPAEHSCRQCPDVQLREERTPLVPRTHARMHAFFRHCCVHRGGFLLRQRRAAPASSIRLLARRAGPSCRHSMPRICTTHSSPPRPTTSPSPLPTTFTLSARPPSAPCCKQASRRRAQRARPITFNHCGAPVAPPPLHHPTSRPILNCLTVSKTWLGCEGLSRNPVVASPPACVRMASPPGCGLT